MSKIYVGPGRKERRKKVFKKKRNKKRSWKDRVSAKYNSIKAEELLPFVSKIPHNSNDKPGGRRDTESDHSNHPTFTSIVVSKNGMSEPEPNLNLEAMCVRDGYSLE